MKSTVETLSPTRVRLAVEIPFAELQPSIDAATKRAGAALRVPGFRPGKAPARVIEQRVGRPALLEEAVNETVPRAYTDAVKEADLSPLGQPEIEVTSLEDGESLSFVAEVDVRPDVKLPAYRGIPLTVADVEVTEEDVDEQLESLRERFGTLRGVERPVQTGDFVAIDLQARVDGAEVEGGSTSGLSYRVGAADLVEGLDEVIVGTSAGDARTFPSTLRHGVDEGRDAEITVSINSVKEQELPPLDDEFAQLASEFDTLDELRADLRLRLERISVLSQGAEARDKLLEYLLDATEIALPASSVDAEMEWRRHDVIHQLEHDDAQFAEYLEQEGKSTDEFEAELREIAERAVTSQFLLDAVAEAESVQVADAELSEYLVRQAARYDLAPQEFANQLLQAGNLPAVVADVRRNKALALLLESAAVTDSSGRPVDLGALTADPTSMAEAGQDLDDSEPVEQMDGADAQAGESAGDPAADQPEHAVAGADPAAGPVTP